MNRCGVVLFVVSMILVVHPVVSEEEKGAELEDMREKADSVLKQTNVTARGNIDVVFELVDVLLEKDKLEEAEQYLVKGLEHFPWNLEYQMKYAELLAQSDRQDKAEEKAKLVLNTAETEALIERARKLLDKEPLPEFDEISRLPGTEHTVVLVPLHDCDKWLVLRVKQELADTLGIPVCIHTIDAELPPYSRDRRDLMIYFLRQQILSKAHEPVTSNAMKHLDLTSEDLEEEENVLKLLKHLLGFFGAKEYKKIKDELEESEGKDPQWDADVLCAILNHSVNPYRRVNVVYLGITSKDIYARDFRFLFGWKGWTDAVMSYRRFTADFNEEPPNQERLIKRTVMQCLASAGHLYGVKRCTDPTCARAYPHTLAEHDAKKGTLCRQCRKGFEKVFGHKLPRSRTQQALRHPSTSSVRPCEKK